MKRGTGDLGHTCLNREGAILLVRRMRGTRGKTRIVSTVRAPTARAY